MDWAEELKMSLRKTTARKGRRAKSRDTQKDTSSASMSTTSTSSKVTGNNSTNKEITLDMTLDLQQSSYGPESSTAVTPPLTSSTLVDSDRRPPPRRISGGWADNGGMKTSKSKSDRFQLASAIKLTANSAPEDDIPVIPDLDDVKDEILLNEIVEPPTIFVNRVASLKELNLDLFPQNAFSAIEDLDLTILTRCLQAPEALDEPDEVWEWDKLFTDVIAEINSDKIDASGNIPSKSPNTNL